MKKIWWWFYSLEVERWKFDVGCSLSKKDEHQTFNSQHRTSNKKQSRLFSLEVERWKFDVERSSFQFRNV